jgi:hypothetical protein
VVAKGFALLRGARIGCAHDFGDPHGAAAVADPAIDLRDDPWRGPTLLVQCSVNRRCHRNPSQVRRPAAAACILLL